MSDTDDVRRQAEASARAFLDKVEVRRSQQRASVQAEYKPSVVTAHQDDTDEKFIQPPDVGSSTVSVEGGISPPGDGGAISAEDNDGGLVEDVVLLHFEMADPDAIGNLTVESGGDGIANILFPTTEITGAVNGVPSTNVICVDGTGWQPI